MGAKKFILCLILLLPATAYMQNARTQLLSILKSYEQLQYFDFSFTYTSLDCNKDTFSLENKGELMFTRYKSKSYNQIGGLYVGIFFSNKFLKNKHFELNADLETTRVFDKEYSNVRIFEKMYQQLNFTRFRINQLIPPLFLKDSSELYNRRFLDKILNEKLLDSEDSLITNIDIKNNEKDKYYGFEIYFNHFDENKAFKKWGKYFDQQFIKDLLHKRFIIQIDKQTLFPVEYQIISDSNHFETYKNININAKNIAKATNFNLYKCDPLPAVVLFTHLFKDKLVKGELVRQDIPAFDFTGVNYLNQQKIRLFDATAEHVLLYVWNSQTIENIDEFKELCKFAEENPQKLTIIGLNNYDESKEYIEKIYKKYNWKFPSIKGKDICKKLYISESPTYALIYKRGNEYMINNMYLIRSPKNILTDVSK